MDQGTNTFFPGTNRRVLIGSPTKQASNGRIVVGIRMPLSGESFIGMPESVVNVQEFFVAPETPAEGPGSEQFEQEVRESMGAPEPLSEAPRLVRTDEPAKANGKHSKGDKAKKALNEFHAQEVGAGRSIN